MKTLTGQGVLYQPVAYMMRSGPPDSLDLMVATNFAVMASNLAMDGNSGRMVALNGGTYTHVPMEITGEGESHPGARRRAVDSRDRQLRALVEVLSEPGVLEEPGRAREKPADLSVSDDPHDVQCGL